MEDIEQRLGLLAEEGLVAGPADTDVEAAQLARGALDDHLRQQDQTRAVAAVVTECVGVEHRREAIVVDDGAEQGQHLATAFERVQLDQRPAVGKLLVAGFPQEFGNTGLGKHVGEALRRHVGRFQREERIEQAIDVGGGCGLNVAVAGKLLQLAFLGAQARAHRRAQHALDHVGRRRIELQPRADIDGGLVRQQEERVCHSVPARRLAEQGGEIDPMAAGGDLLEDVADVACADRRHHVAAPQSEIEIGVLGTEEFDDAERPHLLAPERPDEDRLAGGVETGDDERRDSGVAADVALPGGEQIEALVGRRERTAVLETSPERLRRGHVLEDLDLDDRPGAAHVRRHHAFSSRAVADSDVHPECAAQKGPTLLPSIQRATLANNYQ